MFGLAKSAQDIIIVPKNDSSSQSGAGAPGRFRLDTEIGLLHFYGR
jgi:hypothetical protein